MFAGRTRHRLPRAILALAICGIAYRQITSIEDGQRRRLAFLDPGVPGSDADDSAAPQFRSLVRPSEIDGSVSGRLPTHDEEDRRDSFCDDVLLYMPNTEAEKGHGSQLNGYILAAMIMATYMNKAMVLLEAPKSLSKFKSSSAFGCPPGKKTGINNDFARGLSRIVKHPDWLSSKCAVPCQGTYGYMDWSRIRRNRNSGPYYPRLYTPQEVSCANDNGRGTKVLVVGSREVRDYFEGHFKQRMLQRPSGVAYGWAMRLGAEPRQAERFAQLEDEQDIWDYVSALIARSGLLEFQPWIVRDVENYIKKSELPLDASYDAIHVRRGDKLLESRALVEEFWSERNTASDAAEPQVTSREYIPFAHYLTQLDASECGDGPQTDAPRLVYVATDDPIEIRSEIDALPKDENNNTVLEDGCTKFQFFIGKFKISANSQGTGFHIQDGPANADCFGRYRRNIASISDMMIAAKSDTFVGEYDSSWGRLVRIFRMQLHDETEGDGAAAAPVKMRDMRIAWGDRQPLPPGL
ncbi:hypothetical protein ACHAWF_017769 [Thalassiosira exigua]